MKAQAITWLGLSKAPTPTPHSLVEETNIGNFITDIMRFALKASDRQPVWSGLLEYT